MSISALPYHIQSVNTKFFVTSTEDDQVGQQVETKPGKESIPKNSVCAQLSTLAFFSGSNDTDLFLVRSYLLMFLFGMVLLLSRSLELIQLAYMSRSRSV